MVRKIPKGRVLTYGQVATLVGTKDARKVGWAMHGNKDSTVPCHRVVQADGLLSKNYFFEGYLRQKKRPLEDGVKFRGERQVDMDRCGWKEQCLVE